MSIKTVFLCSLCCVLAAFHLTIVAANHKPYITTRQASLTVSEAMPIGSNITTITAVDVENDPLTFSLDSTVSNILSIDPSTGLLKLTATLNREIRDDYEFRIFVEDNFNGGGAHRREGKLFYLIVSDANDNAPIFVQQPYITKIAENTTVSTSIMKISAIDADLGVNRQVRYKFSNASNAQQTTTFSIGSVNGELKLIAPLDYEKARTYMLVVIAEDLGTPKQQTSTTVIIEVIDVSDMPPSFVQSTYLHEISENVALGTSVVTVEARDGDAGINNHIMYAIVTGNVGDAFAIDSSTGLITVNGSIDAEKTDLYKITVRASEVPEPSSNTTVTVMITVVDQNDNKPQFPQPAYEFHVREDLAKPGRIITDQFNIKDGDKNPEFRRFTYHVVGADSHKFAVDRISGVLTINSTLDYETQRNYTFTVVVTEAGTAEQFSANASVTLVLINVNDNKPVFASLTYNYTLDEQVAAGTHIADIKATDDDLGTFGVVTYELRGDHASYFIVNVNNGSISASKTLDYEVLPRYQFSVFAKDGGGFYQEVAITTVTVELRDVNDNDPLFIGAPYSSGILENLPAGASVFQVSATDKDSGDNGRISFNITMGNVYGAFAINGSGVVTTAKELDRETIAVYSLMIEVYDHGLPRRRSSTELTIQVHDQNDNTPQILPGTYITTNISEGAGGGTVLLSSIPVFDPDHGRNGELTYTMSGGESRFTLNSVTGQLQMSPTGIDRELKSFYDLVINVTDNGSPPRQNSTIVHVAISDINDNIPSFHPDPAQSLAAYTVSVDEGLGTINMSVIDVNATDPDAGVNGVIVYTLSGDEHGFFVIDPNTGLVSVRKELDRESSQMSRDANGAGRFSLSITATDQAMPASDRKAATVRVTVIVNDINDNSPQFSSTTHSTRLSEAARPGSNVIQVSASDADLDYKGKVSYNITSGDPNSQFEVSPNGMILTKKALDADQVSVYNLTLVATDGGTPPLTSSTHVTIHVDDVNDNDPVFNQSMYSAHVRENSAPGTTVAKVFASDKDHGANGQIMYMITNGDKDGVLRIDNITGDITVAAQINREKTQKYTITVQAEDQGQPSSRKALTEVIITVTDENDNYPQFSANNYQAEIPENSAAGTALTLKLPVEVTDADIGTNKVISFSLSGPGSENFIINFTTGVITTSPSSSLDRERNASYVLTITATDGGNKNSTAQLTVGITDRNDESPRFSQSVYTFNVSEDAARGTTIGRVTATDLDAGINSMIFYSSTGSKAFYVLRSTGDIIVDSPLDREYKSDYVFNITAANIVAGAHESIAQIQIKISDVIDDKPYFDGNTLTVHISENASIGTNVTGIVALDKDIGDTITYSIVTGDKYGQFRIHNTTGVLYTANMLERENTTETILYLQAQDSIGLKSDLFRLVIQVDDVNDNSPQFTRDTYDVVYWEESPEGTSILSIKATDADSGQNAAIRYRIDEKNITSYVKVDATTGVVTLGNSRLDREESPLFNLTIRATDLGSPSRSSTAKVSIHLVDINDNSPVFNQTDYHAYVPENQPAGSPVLVVTATDKDVGTNAKLSYALSGAMHMRFYIDPDTGNITTRGPLNREESGASTFTLTLLAVDSAIRPREGTTRIIITVIDENDHAPVFTLQRYSFAVREDVPIGHSIGRVATTDDDINKNARVRYLVTSENTSLPFLANETTGVISTSSTLDRETNTTFIIHVIAQDEGVPPLHSNTTVTIDILDVNDNKPIFSQDVYNVTMRESAFLKTTVTQVVATDPDEGANGQFTYKLIAGDTDDVFNLDANTGLITLKGKLDHETTPRYNLTIAAQDLGTPSLTGSSFVIVSVTDVDDNAPVFHKDQYKADIYENATRGQHVLSVNATDMDAQDSHNIVHYRIESVNGVNVFRIGDRSGEITLNCTLSGCLDREAHARYELQVAAISRANQTEQKSLVSVEIIVLDVNDVIPVFDRSLYFKEVLEDTGSITDRLILVVSAHDTDAGANANVIYRIVTGNQNGVFSINNKTGAIIKLYPLDREYTPFYSLVVEATDMGVPPLSSNTTVNISVLDVNDNHPQLQTPPPILVPENATVGTHIWQLNATDRDSGANAELYFTIISGNEDGSFMLNRTSGELRTAKTLDHELTAKYKITVKAQDLGKPTLSSEEEQLAIFLIDLNDNKPIFTERKASLSVGENLEVGVVVGVVAARDLDTKNLIYYYITNTNERSYFTLNETSGELRTKVTLDREHRAFYFLYIKASNEKLNSTTLHPLISRKRRAVPVDVLSGNTTNTTQAPLPDDLAVQLVIVAIGDANDNAPKFTKTLYTSGVSDNAKHGSNIIRVVAIDPDSGNNSRIAYTIRPGRDSSKFSIDKESGWIMAKDSYAGKMSQEYVIEVMASDNAGQTPNYNDTATVKIYVLTDYQRAVLISGRSPDEVRSNVDEFIRVLQNITGYIINIDDINYYKDPKTDKYDYSRTAVLFHAVDPVTKQIVDRDVVIKKIDQNYYSHKKFFTEWKIKEVKPQVPENKDGEFPLVLAVVIGLAILLAVVILIFCCVVCQLRNRQERKLRAATAASYGGSSQQMSTGTTSSLPTTNLHVTEGSNPMWVDPYQNWGLSMDDDDKAYMQTFKSNKRTSMPYYDNVMVERTNRDAPDTQEASYQNMGSDDDDNYESMAPISSRKSSGYPPASPEPYVSSDPTSPKSLYLQDSRVQVTSI